MGITFSNFHLASISPMLSIWLFFLGIFSLVASAMELSPDWDITNFQRAVDLRMSFTKVKYNILAKNINDEPMDTFVVGIPSEFSSNLAILAPVLKSPAISHSVLNVTLIEDASNGIDGIAYYSVKIPAPIAPKNSIDLSLTMIATHQTVPIPEYAPMSDVQSLTLHTLKYPVSPYLIRKYAVIFVGAKNGNLTSDPSIKDPVETKFTETDDNLFTQPIDCMLKPNTYIPAKLSYDRNGPLRDVSYFKKENWISHWGNALEVREYYELTNDAVKLDSGFNRAKWMSERYGGHLNPAVTTIQLNLPDQKSSDIYFTDKVGNVSTSKVLSNHLLLHPRYPIFGGWHYNFTVGWTHNLSDYLKQGDDGIYVAKVGSLGRIVDAMYEDIEVCVYLPEGADFVDISAPFEYLSSNITTVYSYLDVSTGRKVVTLKYKNMVSDFMDADIYVLYRYPLTAMIKKPLVASVYVFFALIILYVLRKVNLSIKPEHEKKE